MNLKHVNYLKISLIIISILIGFHAVYGGLNLIIDPSGNSLNLNRYINNLPFSNNFFIFGLMLLIFNGLFQLLSAVLLYFNYRYSGIITVICASILLIWTGVQLIYIGMFFYSIVYFIVGIIQLILGLIFCKVIKSNNNNIKNNNYK